jgi:hypothetical protein
VPDELAPLLKVLHTGVRAALTGRQWWGCRSGDGRLVALHTSATIPAGVTLLSVEGDGSAGGKWDRIWAYSWIDHRELFEGKTAEPDVTNPAAGRSGESTAA